MKLLQISVISLAIDPALGRLDYSSLSDQALMEIIVDGIPASERDDFEDEHGGLTDACEWDCVTCVDERVTEISFVCYEFEKAQFPFDFIPPLASIVIVEECAIKGSLDTAVLPHQLIQLNVGINALHGTIAFSTFPQGLMRLKINVNTFEGNCVLEELPATLMYFDASENKFTGEISLNNLPHALHELNLAGNALTGSLRIESLPSSILTLWLASNYFSGEFMLLVCPRYLHRVNISKNDFSGTMVLLQSIKVPGFYSIGNEIAAVVDEHDEKHPWEQRILKEQNEPTDSDIALALRKYSHI